jgi:hypothetical protein
MEKETIFLMLIALGILLIGGGILLGDDESINVPGVSDPTKYDLVCTVRVENVFLYNPEFIGSPECRSRTSEVGSFSLFSFLYKEGNLKMTANGKEVSKNIEYSSLGIGKDFDLVIERLDPGDSVVNFYLYDEDGAVEDSKTLNVKVGEFS